MRKPEEEEEDKEQIAVRQIYTFGFWKPANLKKVREFIHNE